MTVGTFDPNSPLITVTATAVEFLENQLKNKMNSLIRLSTKVSGCTGFAYVIEIAEQAEEGDEVLTISAALSIAVAAQSHDLIRYTEIDYVDDGINGIIKYNNPNVVDECGCGESFNVG